MRCLFRLNEQNLFYSEKSENLDVYRDKVKGNIQIYILCSVFFRSAMYFWLFFMLLNIKNKCQDHIKGNVDLWLVRPVGKNCCSVSIRLRSDLVPEHGARERFLMGASVNLVRPCTRALHGTWGFRVSSV